jgi:hypothetical protein
MSSGCKACVVPRVSVPVPSVDVLRQAAAREGALLAVALSTTSLKHPPQQRRRWIERHPALTGALLGAPAGFAFGAVKLGGEPFIGTDPISHFGGGLVMLPIGVAFGVMVAGAVVLVTKYYPVAGIGTLAVLVTRLCLPYATSTERITIRFSATSQCRLSEAIAINCNKTRRERISTDAIRF